MIVEVVGGADQRPEVRVVDVDELSRVVLALGEVTDAEADEALQAAGLGRLDGADTASLHVDALRAAAEGSATTADWASRWEELVGSAAGGPLQVSVESAAGA
ncbi:hypothetical protein [Blastococcus sp. TF02A-26]|uniref:hypothetical protein n=1 Tax=Blastococcus sp. TF02A-26 TaxID=2250577 RepID=UPI000DE8E3AB|nr:hypothetical protein [Blastococcus sp. TF02A-26]RBY87424.1 hypothetical protein DQ240_07485 [Blastococcus sp. TF02A-26]